LESSDEEEEGDIEEINEAEIMNERGEKRQKIEGEKVGQMLAQEIDYEVFERRFWPRFGFNNKMSPMLVWTEIFSTIKGSSESFNFLMASLPREEYMSLPFKRNFVD